MRKCRGLVNALACSLALAAATYGATTSGSQAVKASPPASRPEATSRPIRLANYQGGETIRYPVPLIRGALTDASIKSVTVTNTSSKRDTRELTGLAYKGQFKALTELVPGENKLIIRAGKDELPLTLMYKPQTNPYVVRVVYITDKSGNTEYQTPLPKDPQDYRGKLDTAMKLMQTFTAERLNDVGYGRATFNLELDANGTVNVHVLKGGRPIEYYHKLDGGQLYGEVGGELGRKLPGPKCDNLVIPAFTRFDPNTQKALAHTALGGGNLALFGGGDLFTWPNSLADTQKAFMDVTAVDPKQFFSDSVGRHTFWGTASTTMGAALHELGHTFGLPHTLEPHDIMTRGHDRFNRFFTLVEPPHAGRKDPYEFKDNEIAVWAPVSGAALPGGRFFAMDDRAWSDRGTTGIRLDVESRSIIVESENGIRYVGLNRYSPKSTEAVYHVPLEGPKTPPKQVKIAIADVGKRMKTENVSVRVLDDQGLWSGAKVPELLGGSFVQAWRFAAVTLPWNDAARFVEVDARKLAEIEASAASAKLVPSRTAFVDFLALAPGDRKANVTAYAVRTIRADNPRKVKLFTGSDDALRIWLNGKVITEVLKARAAEADSETTVAELQKGGNRLVVEVSQINGGWGLYLRIEDENGAKLELKDDGELGPTDNKTLDEIRKLLSGK